MWQLQKHSTSISKPPPEQHLVNVPPWPHLPTKVRPSDRLVSGKLTILVVNLLLTLFRSDHPTLAGDWHSEDVECKISERHWDPSCRGKICVIKKVSFPESSVWIKTSDSTVEVFNSMLEPVQPLKYDKVNYTFKSIEKIRPVSKNILTNYLSRSKYYTVTMLARQANCFRLTMPTMLATFTWMRTHGWKLVRSSFLAKSTRIRKKH